MQAFIPIISTLSPRKVISVTSHGDPNKVMDRYMKALYGAAYHAKMKVYKPKGIKMPLGKLAARWPDAHLKVKSEWTGVWGVEVPDYVKSEDITQKDPAIEASLQIWPGGKYAEILHIGPYSEEEPTVEKLHTFIKESGYAIAGDHEEEYLTMPGVKNQKTVIRYPIKKI